MNGFRWIGSVPVQQVLDQFKGLYYVDARTLRANVLSDMDDYIASQTVAWFYNQLCGDVAADKGDRIPTGKGESIHFDRVLQQAKDTTALTAGTQPDSVSLYTMDIQATPVEYGARINIDRVPALTARHLKLLDQGSKGLGLKLADTADYIVMTSLAANGYRIRADQDSTYQTNVSTTSDGNAGMTTLISTSLVEAEDFWNGGRVTITGIGTAYAAREAIYETRLVSDFATATGTVTVSVAFSAVVKSGCTIHIAVGTGIVSTDIMTTDVFTDAMTRLALNKCERFGGKPGQNLPVQGQKAPGYVHLIVNPYTMLGFLKDTTWVNTGIQQLAENLMSGQPTKWMGTVFNGTTQPWREDVDGTENETGGAVHPVHFLGQHAYGISDVAAPGAKPPYGLVTTYLDAKGLGQTVPRYDEIGGIMYFCVVPLNDMWNVTLLCGAPSLA